DDQIWTFLGPETVTRIDRNKAHRDRIQMGPRRPKCAALSLTHHSDRIGKPGRHTIEPGVFIPDAVADHRCADYCRHDPARRLNTFAAQTAAYDENWACREYRDRRHGEKISPHYSCRPARYRLRSSAKRTLAVADCRLHGPDDNKGVPQMVALKIGKIGWRQVIAGLAFVFHLLGLVFQAHGGNGIVSIQQVAGTGCRHNPNFFGT